MKKLLFVLIPLGMVLIFVVTAPFFETRFRLSSASPSGDAHVRGLPFQGSKEHPLDGTLRLFVSADDSTTRQQTTIPWDRDLRINWKTISNADTFGIEKNSTTMIEFQILGSDLICLSGKEYLAEDPYR